MEITTYQKTHKPNICWDCTRYYSCPWTKVDAKTNKIQFKEVPGWTARPIVRSFGSSHGKPVLEGGYEITACPLFIPDPPRRSQREIEEELHWAAILED